MSAMNTDATTTGRPSPLWRNRDYMLFWSGRTVSALGTNMSGIAFPLSILALTRSAALAGLAGGLRAIPYVLLSLPAGVLVDHWDRKRVMLLCDTARALTLGSIPVAWLVGHLSVAQLYAATTIEGTLLLFYNTANHSSLPRLVPREQLAAASAQDEGAYYAASLVGPAVGGALYQVGRVLPFLGDALSYLVSVLSLLLIKADLRQENLGGATRPRHLSAGMLEGLTWLWRQPIIRAVSLLDTADTLVASGLSLVVIILAQQHHASPTTIGTIFSIAGVGGVLGSVTGAQVQKRASFGQTVIGVRWALAALWPLYAIAPNALALGAITAAIYFVNPIKNVAYVSYCLPLIPDSLRGRVTTAWDLLPSVANVAGASLSGLALQAIGPQATIVIGAVIVLALALGITLHTPIRNAPSLHASRESDLS